jgi:hypothetical protein
MGNLYISPTGAGDRSGSTWANAATIDRLASLIDKAKPNDQILIRADQGSYHVTSQIAIHDGGALGKPVVIRGVNGDGNSAQAVITGDRPARYAGDVRAGNELFKLLDGADHLKFKDLLVKNTGTAFRFGADVGHVTIDNVDARNVAYFVNDRASGAATSATIDKLTIRNADIIGFSDIAIRLAYDTHGVTIHNVTADMAGQTGALYPEGIHLDGTVHDVTIRDTVMANVRSTGPAGSYWNGDGFATERGVHDVRFIDTLSSGNTDAGYDLKSSHTTLTGAVADDNSRNFRFWSSVEMTDSAGYDPHKRGGTSSQNQVWIASTADVRIQDSVFSDSSKGTTVFAGSGGTIAFDDVTTYHATGTRLTGLYHSLVTGLNEIADHYVYPGSLSHDLG